MSDSTGTRVRLFVEKGVKGLSKKHKQGQSQTAFILGEGIRIKISE